MNNLEEDSKSEYEPALWLNELLGSPGESNIPYRDPEREDISALFLARCDEAAAGALFVARLRRERQRVGFVPMSLEQYINGLVKVAEVSVAPVFKWLGIQSLSLRNAESTAKLARLAREIGIGLRELSAYMRIGLAGQFGSAPIALLVARRRSAGGEFSELDECEYLLEQIEATYDPAGLSELREIQALIQTVFAVPQNEAN